MQSPCSDFEAIFESFRIGLFPLQSKQIKGTLFLPHHSKRILVYSQDLAVIRVPLAVLELIQSNRGTLKRESLF